MQHSEEFGIEELESFKSQVLEGFQRGMREARGILGALEVLDGALAGEIGQTERLVEEGLEQFFAKEAEPLRS